MIMTTRFKQELVVKFEETLPILHPLKNNL